MRKLIAVAVVLGTSLGASFFRRASGAGLDPIALEEARAVGHLLADDDLAIDRGWWLPSAAPGSLSVSVGLGIGRRVGPEGAYVRWGLDVEVQIPFERFAFEAGRRAVARRLGAESAAAPGFGTERKAKEDVMKKRSWGAVAVLPGAIALAGAAAAKGKATTGAGTSASAVGSASASSIASPSGSASVLTADAPLVAGVKVVAPIVAGPLNPAALHALVSAAWKAAGVEHDDALSALSSRARASALAPELRLRAYRGFDVGARVYRTDDVAVTTNDAAQTFFEVRLGWRLDRLVFADEEIAVERMKLERAELRQRISGKVVDLVLRWQRARRAANDPSLLDSERDEAAITAVETLLALDAVTGGVASTVLLSPGPD